VKLTSFGGIPFSSFPAAGTAEEAAAASHQLQLDFRQGEAAKWGSHHRWRVSLW